MSLPGPVPNEPKRFGSLREPPASAPRPYAERLKLAGELVEETKVRPGSAPDFLPTVAQILLIVGALAPFVLAIPGFGQLFAPLILSLLPFSLDLLYAAVFLIVGWYGAILMIAVGGAGLIAARIGESPAAQASPALRRLGKVAVLLIILAVVALLTLLPTPDGGGASVAAAWIVLTSAAGLYGARLAARRENFLGAIVGAMAVAAGPATYFGLAALVCLAASGKAFPGQTVARYPWGRSQVAIEPITAPGGIEPEPEGLPELERRGIPKPQALFVATVALVFGAFAPVVYAIPGFGVGLFGSFVGLLWPFSTFLALTASWVEGAFSTLTAGGPGLVAAVFVLVWFVGVTTAGALIAARAVSSRKRKWAALAGAVLLIVGGRPLFGIAALLAVAYAWELFDASEAEAHSEAAHVAAAH